MNLTDINEIRALLSRHGFRFSKSMGQNFLTAGLGSGGYRPRARCWMRIPAYWR